MPHRVEMKDEPLSSYREAVRARLQELMLTESYPPGHPLVSATARHLEMSTAEEAARCYSAPSLEHFYRGCDLYHTAPVRAASPLSPEPAQSSGGKQTAYQDGQPLRFAGQEVRLRNKLVQA